MVTTTYDDDVEPKTLQNAGPKPKLRIMNKNMAPPDANQFRVLLELTGAGSGNDRPGVDIVAVLDVSGSMNKERLEKLKITTRILIKKLHTMDRLSVITFSQLGICFMMKTQLQMHPLQPMTEAAQKNIEKIVNNLQHVDDVPNITAGLEKALEVLNARDDTTNRAAIVLISDGDPGHYNGDATKVSLGDVPLYKFSFAHQYEADGLDAIGKSSRGGMFPLADVDDLSIALSQCLAELCDIVVQDFELTFTPVKAKIDDVEKIATIKKVYAGNCQQSRDDTTGSVTVLINGELYSGEIRKIMVDLLLPAISKQITTNVLQITHSYTIKGERFRGLPLNVDVIRTGKLLEDVKGQKTKTMSNDNLVQSSGNMLLKQGQNLFKGALNAMATRENKKENEKENETLICLAPQGLTPKAAKAGENSDATSTDNHKLPKGILPDISSLQGAGKYVIEQGQGASKYVMEQGQKIFQGLRPIPGVNYKKENPSVPLDQSNPKSEVEAHGGHSKQVITEPMINDLSSQPMLTRPELLDVDPVAHLKDQILTAIQYFNTIEGTLRAMQDTLNKAST